LLESINAFELRIFRGHGTQSNAARALNDFEADIERGIFRVFPVPASAWDTARALSRSHTANLGCRPLDILQVAIALVARADAFLTFDRNQAALAQASGFKIDI
jgi:predicted nucleic acid-binding protein